MDEQKKNSFFTHLNLPNKPTQLPISRATGIKSLDPLNISFPPRGRSSANNANYHMHDRKRPGGPSVSSLLICASMKF